MTVTITPEKPNTPDAIKLIDELEGTLAPYYPDESRHGYSVDKLIQQGVAFFVVRVDGKPAGCGGVQLYDDYAELKRMYVNPDYRGHGLAKQLLKHLAQYSQDHEITILRLETGIHQHEALGLYEQFGFVRREHFGEYQPDPNSVFMEKTL
ncbi:MAG: GNAT family N-acetyltransferase [Chloroflexota bacterium]